MTVICLLQGGADGADTAVHHIGGSDDVGAGFGMRQGLTGQHRHRLVIHDVPGVVDDAVLSVSGVRIQRDVRNHCKIGMGVLDSPHRSLNEAVGVGALDAIEALLVGIDYREQGDGGDAQFDRLAERAEQPVDALALDARHRLDLLRPIIAIENENRVN